MPTVGVDRLADRSHADAEIGRAGAHVLLDGVLLDESRNALGRESIAHLREELRAYDRQQEAPITRSPRW
mgnify:CR=1 FL=1